MIGKNYSGFKEYVVTNAICNAQHNLCNRFFCGQIFKHGCSTTWTTANVATIAVERVYKIVNQTLRKSQRSGADGILR